MLNAFTDEIEKIAGLGKSVGRLGSKILDFISPTRAATTNLIQSSRPAALAAKRNILSAPVAKIPPRPAPSPQGFGNVADEWQTRGLKLAAKRTPGGVLVRRMNREVGGPTS